MTRIYSFEKIQWTIQMAVIDDEWEIKADDFFIHQVMNSIIQGTQNDG